MKAAEELAQLVGTAPACKSLGVSRATFYRRKNVSTASKKDSPRRSPRALRDEETRTVLDTLHAERFVDKAPAEVYATLLDEGTYFCSIRTMYRILDAHSEVRERRNQLRHPEYQKPELLATAPNQVWSWDITKLLGPTKWTYFYLYVILDIYSRYAVGWLLASRESGELAQRFIRETLEKQSVDENQLTLHSDRGPSMKSHTVAQLLATLGVIKSHSRPHVSNDNPFSESQFKTLKYRPDFPKRFQSFEEALSLCREFFTWYNEQHHHWGLGLLTPATVHYDRTADVLAHRQDTLDTAYAAHPERFVTGKPKPLKVPDEVWINPPQAKKTLQIVQNGMLIENEPSPQENDLEISLLTNDQTATRHLTPTQSDASLNKMTPATEMTKNQSHLESTKELTNYERQVSQNY